MEVGRLVDEFLDRIHLKPETIRICDLLRNVALFGTKIFSSEEEVQQNVFEGVSACVRVHVRVSLFECISISVYVCSM